MKRKFEFLDIWVTIGMAATVLGAYVFIQASNGGAGFVNAPAKPMTNPSMNVLVQSMLQPAMGQAIVDHAMLERQFAADMIRGASKLTQATRAAERHPVGGLDTIESRAVQAQADHQARVQYVMGRTIMNLTRQGMRAGALSANNLSNSLNDRIIATAQAMGERMDQAFAKNWQPRLGQWIVAAAKQERRYARHLQERMGKATVNVASLQHAYQTTRSDLRNQFRALTAAAARTEAQDVRFARLSTGEMYFQRALGQPAMAQVPLVEARTFPEIPFTFMIAACVGLVLMFLLGVTLPRGSREAEVVADPIEERKEEGYRKAV